MVICSLPEDEQDIQNFLDTPYQMQLPTHNFKYKEIEMVIKKGINPKKSTWTRPDHRKNPS
jgi:hypothetical protein